jgi:cytochrome c2
LLLSATPALSEIPQPELGRQLITKLGCHGCHTITDPEFSNLRKPAPDLRRIAAKTDPSWVYRWILAPRKIRPTTWMPHLLAEEYPEDARAVVAYLWKTSGKADYAAPPAGDAVRGEGLFRSTGCTGCHLREDSTGRDDYLEPYRLQGPNLLHLGSKVGAGWLYAWLKDPQSYAPLTLMPNLRLSNSEAADLTAFLMASRSPASEGDLIEFDEAEAELGRDTIEISGCYGCHLIPGFLRPLRARARGN